jgi:hypothetical protein
MKRLAFLFACIAATACSHATPPGASDALTQLRAIGRDATCTSDPQCRTVPVGAKACGGPQSYLAYSTAKTDPERAGELAERYRKEREAHNQASGQVSDCRFIADPGAQCRAGTCQLRNPGGAVE